MNPSFIDCHAHVNFAAYDSDRDEVISRALENNTWMINVGTQKDTSKKAVEIAEKYKEGVYAIVGTHPIHTDKSFHDEKELGEGNREFTSRGEEFDYEYYKNLAKHPKVVGIGECGLDYYRMEHGTWNTEHKKQEEAFRKQIELAIEVGKPLMLHVRNPAPPLSSGHLPLKEGERGISAYRDAVSILKSYIVNPVKKPSSAFASSEFHRVNHKSSPRGNFHFFAGSIDELKEILDVGFNVSFTGVITFTRDYDELVKYAPIDRILSETDCPYVTPAPHRGKRNEPIYVAEVVKRIAEIKGMPLKYVQAQLLKNARQMFKV
ncbi:MAG: TatD family hydrolase [bacterium]|nr:TatD family hydrolase [bacterium]